MTISRRNLLHTLGVGAVAGAVDPLFGSFQLPHSTEPGTAKRPGVIRLDANENPYGPAPGVIAAMREELASSNRFPATSDGLLQKIAGLNKIGPEQIVLGCGASEILRMAATEFLGPGKHLILASPTFDLVTRYARDSGAEIRAVPLSGEGAHDLKAMILQSGASTGLVYICNPNNPTGTLTLRKDLEEFLRNLPPNLPVIIDEAYHDYVIGPSTFYASFIERPVNDKRLIVLRTFSKVYGLAGLRIGYAVTAPEMALRLSRHRLQFGVNTLALRAAMAALEDPEYIRVSVKRNNDERTEFQSHAIYRYLRMIDSHTNFIPLRVHRPVEEVVELFRTHQIILGPEIPTMDRYLRVTIGTHDEMQEFWRVYDMLPPSGHAH